MNMPSLAPRTLFRAALLILAAAIPSARGQMNEGETVADAAVPKNPAMQPVADVPGLPRVLLIGDSISIAYTVSVRELLAGKANVHRIPVNGSQSNTGRSALTHWLGDGKWDVVHFNFGLHDAKLVIATGLPAVSREDYVNNLKVIAQKLKATGAKVIFATTTPIPETLRAPSITAAALPPQTRLFDSIPERNQLAVTALSEMGVPVIDLYAVILPHQEKLQNRNDVHFKPEGSMILARAVAGSILQQLPDKQ
jgi:hypothetical protein